MNNIPYLEQIIIEALEKKHNQIYLLLDFMSTRLQKSITYETMRKNLNGLIKKGIVKKTGATRSAKYWLTDDYKEQMKKFTIES